MVGLACVCVVVDAGAGRVGRVRVRRAGVGVGWCGRGVVGVVRRIGLGEGGVNFAAAAGVAFNR